MWVAPKLIVECLSPSNRKGSLHQLLADYETAGVAEVWLLDPRKRSAESYVLLDGQLSTMPTLAQGEWRSNTLDVSVSLATLWRVFESGRA